MTREFSSRSLMHFSLPCHFQAKRAVIDPNLSFMRQLEEYESKLGFGSVVTGGILPHPEAASELAPSPKAKRPCLTLPLDSLLSQATTPAGSGESFALMFESASPGPSSRSSPPPLSASPSTALPGCHSPIVSSVCHSPLLSPS